jgi:glycosyltransferase 2 family protein
VTGRRIVRYALSAAVSALCVYLAARRVDWVRFASTVMHVRTGRLVGGAVAYVASVVVAGFRWRAVAWPIVALPAVDAVEIVFIGSLGNVLIPRLGDLLRAVLTGRRRGATTGRVLGSLIVERFADVLMLLVLAAGLYSVVDFPVTVRVGIMTLIIAALAALVMTWFAADWLPAFVRRAVGLVSRSFASSLAALLESFSGGVRGSVSSRQLPVTVVLSACVWVLSGLSIILMVGAFDLPVPWFAGLFVMLVINLGGVIPASPGSLGVYHYVVVLALSVWTSDSSAALGFAVVQHAMGLMLMAVCGGIALWRQGLGFNEIAASLATSAA